MKVREWILKWYVLTGVGVCVNLLIAAMWISHAVVKAEENVQYVLASPKISVTEDLKLVEAQLDDGSEFSITIKEARALREVVRMLLEERIADLEAELFAARGGSTVGTVYSERELRLLEALVAKLSGLRDILSVQEHTR